MRITLPYHLTLRSYQADLWNALVHLGIRRALTIWPRRNGKDLIALNILVAKALQRKATYFYIAPYLKQVRQIIWQGIDGNGRRFLDYIPPEVIQSKHEQDMRIVLKNGSTIQLQGSDNVDAIVGTNPYGVIFTEYSLHKPEAWHYLRPVLAENQGWALFNGTPRGMNHMHSLFTAVKDDPQWFVQHLTRDDTGVPTLSAIEEDRKSGMPESLIQQEYYCSWTASSEETLIPLDIIQPTINRILSRATLQTLSLHPRIMGVDVAFSPKGDQAVIARRQHLLLHPLEKHRGLDNMALASRIQNLIQSWRPHFIYIDAGRGEGVISRLNQLGYGHIVIPVNFGGRTFHPLYYRKKEEMWCRAKNWFARSTLYPSEDPDAPIPSIPDDRELIRDLSAPTFTLTDKSEIRLESKESLRARGYTSTDSADALILTFAEEEPEVTPEDIERSRRVAWDYDYLNKEDEYDPDTFIDKMYTSTHREGTDEYADTDYL